VARVRSAWRDRRIAREAVPLTPRAVVAAPSTSAPTAANTIRTSVGPLALQRGRLLDTLEAAQ